jgi:uncharacterized protein (TIGR02466 family)
VTSKVQVQHVFATPLITVKFDNPEINRQLEETILRKRSEDPGIQRSNKGGWHSNTDFPDWGGKAGQWLTNQIILLANRNTERMGDEKGPLRWGVSAWANVNENGAANHRHIHGGCYWSAVYYVRIDEGTGGQLVLHDPRVPEIAMHAPRLRFRNAGGERVLKVRPEPGRLIIFPAWLSHEVEAWNGEGMRISLAFNLMAPPLMAEKKALAGPAAAGRPARAAAARNKPKDTEKEG